MHKTIFWPYLLSRREPDFEDDEGFWWYCHGCGVPWDDEKECCPFCPKEWRREHGHDVRTFDEWIQDYPPEKQEHLRRCLDEQREELRRWMEARGQ